MIKAMLNSDILDGLKRKDHVLFSMPLDGGKFALEFKEAYDQGGYNFLHYLHDEFTVPIEDAPSKDFSAENLGTTWKFVDEDAQVTFWGFYNHNVEIGWHPGAYSLLTRRLDEWWTEHIEAEFVRPVRSLILGAGKNLRKIAEPRGGTNWNTYQGIAVLANTEAELGCYWLAD